MTNCRRPSCTWKIPYKSKGTIPNATFTPPPHQIACLNSRFMNHYDPWTAAKIHKSDVVRPSFLRFADCQSLTHCALKVVHLALGPACRVTRHGQRSHDLTCSGVADVVQGWRGFKGRFFAQGCHLRWWWKASWASVLVYINNRMYPFFSGSPSVRYRHN